MAIDSAFYLTQKVSLNLEEKEAKSYEVRSREQTFWIGYCMGNARRYAKSTFIIAPLS